MSILTRPFRRTRRPAPPRTIRPHLDALEDRTLLSFTYVPVDFSKLQNHRIQTSGPGSASRDLPEGNVVLGGIPFNIPQGGKNAWVSSNGAGAYPRVLNIPIGTYGVGEVQTLINTTWGKPGPASYAKLEFFGTNGAYHRKDLVGDVDVRDFNRAGWTNSINLTTTINVARSTDSAGYLNRMDKQTIDLPAAFDTQVLQTLRVTDSGGQNFSGVYFQGLTVGVVPSSSNATSTVLTASGNSVAVGQPITFTARVSPSLASGQVMFLDGATTLSTQTLTNGTATFVTSSLAAGPHTITARYLGGSTLASSVSNGVAVSVGTGLLTPTSTGLTASSTSLPVGQALTFTATVSPTMATGQVQFLDSGTPIGVADLFEGSAVFTTTSLTSGLHNVTARYLGSTAFGESTSNAVVVDVTGISTAISLNLSAPTLNAGQSLVMTVTIDPSSATGQVRFLDGDTELGVAPLAGGAATFAISTLGVGSHTLWASYEGNAIFGRSQTATQAFVVKPATPPSQLPPQVRSVVVTRGAQPSLRIVFSQAVNASLARNLRNFTVRRGGLARNVGVVRADYSEARRSIALTLGGRLSAKDTIRLIIKASGIVNLRKVQLDGNGDGRPGDNFDRQIS